MSGCSNGKKHAVGKGKPGDEPRVSLLASVI